MSTDLSLGDGKPKAPGTWDYYGSLDPAHHRGTWSMLTFSVGVFQWVEKGQGKIAKKAGAIKRFSGPVAAPHEVYEKVLAFIAAQSGAVTAPFSSDTPERSGGEG